MNTSPLKAMFWKECRENVRWAVLALLALSLGLAYAWYHLFQQSYWPSFSNVWSTENLVLTITTPLIGLALGLLQVLPELRRDQWAFLVHRPASRTTLFFGKALPGVCLYLLATSPPLLGLAAWAASPSHVPAPFDFRFTLAGWAAILAGLPFYFAGLLVALRPARWYGSRALPLLTALLAPWAAAQLTEFLPVVLICLLVTAVLCAAAWGSFLTGGEYKEQTRPARFALGLALYPAMLAVGVGALMLSMAAYNALGGRAFGANEWWRTDYRIDTQGRIFEAAEHNDGKGHTEKTVTDLAGRPVDARLWQNLNQQHKLLNLSYLFLKNTAETRYSHYSDASRYVLNLTTDIAATNQTYWYYETTSRRIICYNVAANVASVRGYLGPDGFGPDPARVRQFEAARPEENQLAGFRLLQFPHSLYWHRLADPAVGLIQAAPGSEGIRGTTAVGGSAEGTNEEPGQVLAVAADRQITLYAAAQSSISIAPTKLFSTPMAFDMDSGSGLQIAMLPDHSRFFFWYEVWDAARPNHVVSVAADGRVVKTETVPSPASRATAAKPPSFIQGLPALMVPPAAMATSAVYAVIGHTLKDQTAESWWRGFGSGGLLFVALFFSTLGGLAAAIPAWLISRRLGDGWRGQVSWGLGVFWLGGYGVLLLLALRAWPARVPCPNCGRQRAVDNEACEHCGAAWARPRRDGTEIFDTNSREAAAR